MGAGGCRLRRLEDEGERRVREGAAAHVGGDGPGPAPGRGRGIACARYTNVKTYAGVGVELEVGAAADVILHRAVIAADAGEVIDHDDLAAQLEGGFLQAASWTLHEEVRFDRDGIESRDWDRYPIHRFAHRPEERW